MKAILIGATGRVGQSFLELVLGAGHEVTVLARDPSRIHLTHKKLNVLKADVLDKDGLSQAYRSGKWDALINVVGGNPLKPSTIVTNAAEVLVSLAMECGTRRYLGITGTAEMPKTLFGKISIFLTKRTPIGNGIRDHDEALSIIKNSSLDWFLVGCPWIKDGPTKGNFKRNKVFSGGMRTIHPGDVAQRLLEEFEEPTIHCGIEGIWY